MSKEDAIEEYQILKSEILKHNRLEMLSRLMKLIDSIVSI